jgi:hypothetical protein
MNREEVAAAVTVRRWLAGTRSQEVSLLERDRWLALLADFCRWIGQSPDQLVASLLHLTEAGDLSISAKRRTVVNCAIDEFVGTRGLEGKDAVVTGNTLRSFLVHNGIFIQGSPWSGPRRHQPPR